VGSVKRFAWTETLISMLPTGISVVTCSCIIVPSVHTNLLARVTSLEDGHACTKAKQEELVVDSKLIITELDNLQDKA
jgi:hypothetical protein